MQSSQKYEESHIFVFQLSWEREKYWVKHQRYELGRDGRQTWEPACRSSLQFPLQLWLVTEFYESQHISATTNGGRRLRTNKSRQSRLAPHCSSSLPQFLRLWVFSPLPFCHFSFLHRQQKLEIASFEVLFALSFLCFIRIRRTTLVAESSQITYQWKIDYLSTDEPYTKKGKTERPNTIRLSLYIFQLLEVSYVMSFHICLIKCFEHFLS